MLVTLYSYALHSPKGLIDNLFNKMDLLMYLAYILSMHERVRLSLA